MVSPILYDTITNPSNEIKQLYKSQSAPEFVNIVENHFKELLSPQDAFYQIPPLGVSHPPPLHRQRSLVRFMGMVQDTSASPEVYLSELDDGSFGGWGIYENQVPTEQDVNDDRVAAVDYSKLRERETVWVVTLPAQSGWARDRFSGPEFPSPTSFPSYTCSKEHKHPSDSKGGFGISAKLYDGRSNLKPGETKIFVGILDEESLEDEDFNEPQNTSKTTQPILHVLFMMDSPDSYVFDMGQLRASLPADTSDARKELIEWIADEGLGGDTSTATWLLLLSLTKVQSRSPPILPLSLTIATFPDPPKGVSFGPAIISVLQSILPAVETAPLTLERINGRSLIPNSVNEDLHAGLLQQPRGTMMIVTESGIREGRVSESGLKNLNALQSAISTQSLAYSFPYSSFSFNIDLIFAVLTSGSKSAFLNTDIIVRLRDGVAPNSLYKESRDIQLPSKEKLDSFRDYIAACRKLTVTLEEEVGKFIEDEFVRLRRESASALSSDDLARRMTIAKLLAASQMESKLTKDIWSAATLMDESRSK